MSDFFRFPHTPHIAWLGEQSPRDDKVLSNDEVRALLAGSVVVEEKLDGANLGLSISPGGEIRAQNRGQYLSEPYAGQFSRLAAWVAQHRYALLDQLTAELIVFGEWCAAKHSLDYGCLPDWFMVFDVYDRRAQRFWSTTRRNELAAALGLQHVPCLFRGKTTLSELRCLLDGCQSRYRNGAPEGIVIRSEDTEWSHARAKLVRAEFTQAIGEHWRSRGLEWNRVTAVQHAGAINR